MLSHTYQCLQVLLRLARHRGPSVRPPLVPACPAIACLRTSPIPSFAEFRLVGEPVTRNTTVVVARADSMRVRYTTASLVASDGLNPFLVLLESLPSYYFSRMRSRCSCIL